MSKGFKIAKKLFAKSKRVFGVRLFATENVEEKRFLHAANIMREYLDNDGDGRADSKKLVRSLKKEKACLTLFENESELDSFLDKHEQKLEKTGLQFQDLLNDEIILSSDKSTRFDASLEEVFHLISDYGYSQINPKALGHTKDSIIGGLMTDARGGHFTKTPKNYPKNAYYTYDDKSCDYECQHSEFIYWAITSYLGGQNGPGRFEEIRHEWKLNTPNKIQASAPELYDFLSNPDLGLPTVLPDGII